WLAPECCYKKPLFSKKSDVWAFGTLMFEVFSNGSKPFLDYEDLAIIRAIRKAAMPPPPPDTPVLAASLLKQIWILKADYRPNFQEIGKALADIIQKSPPILPSQMVVNQLKGVKREKHFEYGNQPVNNPDGNQSIHNPDGNQPINNPVSNANVIASNYVNLGGMAL
ncbi:hypothetical protein TELCIR_18360, partial [Teladorsagia circumcincta]